MKCKCKNEMIEAGRTKSESDYDVSITQYYWCKNCGRLYSDGDVDWWLTPDILPKPKEIKNDKKEWCDCKSWKMSDPLYIKDDEEFCRFCGKKLHKTKLVDCEGTK